jgi:hypothetical protein
MKQAVCLAILFVIAIGAIDLKHVVEARSALATTDRNSCHSADCDSHPRGSWLSRENILPTGSFQEARGTRPECPSGQAPSGDLGYAGTECHGCVISGKHERGKPDIEFDSEPIISDIRKDGPAAGKLEEQDVLVAIDGQPITTRAAAIQLSWLEPDKPVRLTVRRNGLPTDVEIVPVARCRKVTPDLPPGIYLRRRVLP